MIKRRRRTRYQQRIEFSASRIVFINDPCAFLHLSKDINSSSTLISSSQGFVSICESISFSISPSTEVPSFIEDRMIKGLTKNRPFEVLISRRSWIFLSFLPFPYLALLKICFLSYKTSYLMDPILLSTKILDLINVPNSIVYERAAFIYESVSVLYFTRNVFVKFTFSELGLRSRSIYHKVFSHRLQIPISIPTNIAP